MPGKKVKVDGTTSVGANSIVDNHSHRRVGDLLRERIEPGSNLSIVSAYFTIYAYQALREVLEKAGPMRFLYGEPRGVGEVDPQDDQDRAFHLTEDGGIDLKKVLAQKVLAKDCAEWIQRQVEIRTIEQTNFLHGKLYHIAPEDSDSTALVGSSNFTLRGLGLSKKPNIELNLEVQNEEDRQALLHWFNELWDDDRLTTDVKKQVLTELERAGKVYAPEFVYYKTLFHVLEKELEKFKEREDQLTGSHLYDSEIWKKLFQFQKHGAISAINRLLRHNGCIIADSVGLGKTWTALAVIKFFELRNEKVLVLCPKKLMENWMRYTSWANYSDNIFEKDRLNYGVVAHTDLSRTKGSSGSAADLSNFNWGIFDLIVIDESHNFRNEGKDRTDEDGNRVLSRYGRLLEEVIKAGVPTKVLMLSATPVNTSLQDLRNQMYLMTEKRYDAFEESLGIRSFHEVFNAAEKAFKAWDEKRRNQKGAADKSKLLEDLGEDFLSLLDEVTLARSRQHVERFYPEVVKTIGGFPERKKPKNLYPATDSKDKLSYEDIYERMGKFRLAMYMPSEYLLDKSELDAEKQAKNFDQRDRERSLVGMMRTNLLKRLESSVKAYQLTLERILEKMEDWDKLIEKWQEQGTKGMVESMPDFEETEEGEEGEDFVVGSGKKVSYRLDELDVDRWQEDLKADRVMFSNLYEVAKQVTPARDEKLAELEKLLKEKVRTAPKDKDGIPNRKALVFTAFSDTAVYLHEEIGKRIKTWKQDDVEIALVTGSQGGGSSTSFIDTLKRFSPKGQQSDYEGKQIDILISTDCLSEGQNLQDCDLVVNYDIHWNPVRLMQRFGRIDRLGSRNRDIGMVNFWPMQDLERYIDLKDRVEARMMLVDATATGRDNPLSTEEVRESVQLELDFRGQQVLRVSEETLGIEDVQDSIAMSDLTLDDFIADLLSYIEGKSEDLKNAPCGIYAIADANNSKQKVQPGVIFCLKQKDEEGKQIHSPNRLHPYFLVYVQEDGNVRYTFQNVGQTLNLFRALATGHKNVDMDLENIFNQETNHGQDMQKYEHLLDAVVRNIAQVFSRSQHRALTRRRGTRLVGRGGKPDDMDKFELITWLIIMNKAHATG